MKALLVVGPYNNSYGDLIRNETFDYLVGADSGALLLAQLGYTVDCSIGDFDSVTGSEFDFIKANSKEMHVSSSIKDATDSHLAIQLLKKRGFTEITIIGGLGKRLDHTISNLFMLRDPSITIKGLDSMVYCVDPGSYDIENKYKYVSFFAIEPVLNLDITGFKYELRGKELSVYDPLCVSNEGSGNVTFTSGKLLVIHQNE